MIKRIRNPHQADVLLFQEPQRIADWETMGDAVYEAFDAGQSFSIKTWDIKFIYGFTRSVKEVDLRQSDIDYFNMALKSFPEFLPEIREFYPSIELMGDSPLLDSDNS